MISKMKIINLHHTNYFFIENDCGKYLAIDNGYPCTLYEYKRKIKEAGIHFDDIVAAIVTHIHIDHAGLLGELCEVIPDCYLIGNQREKAITEMERIILKDTNYNGSENNTSCVYKKIDVSKIKFVSVAEINNFLKENKFGGTIIETPSHSDDSITYISDDGVAIIGDLTPRSFVMEDNEKEIDDWKKIVEYKVTRVIPSHANEFMLN